ncbi:hypothetical protein A3K63_05660 [Candidatus Micrarchaeota archaeon RBG_16_49_10]|nr:MAG: hypothetical protein A3K63_05660 [Candidatus Micrarchaeota archaeon RBG_16_49_10]
MELMSSFDPIIPKKDRIEIMNEMKSKIEISLIDKGSSFICFPKSNINLLIYKISFEKLKKLKNPQNFKFPTKQTFKSIKIKRWLVNIVIL